MLTIYHVPGTRGLRAIWLCEELSVPYTVELVDFSPEFRRSDAWRAFNPVGKVPVLHDSNDDLTLFESGAMVQYILDRYGNGALQPPAGTPEHGRYLQWCWFAESTFARPLGEVVNHGREFPGDKKIPAVVAEMQARGLVCAEAVGAAIGDAPYILGTNFSAADIMLGYSLMIGERLLPDGLPAIVQPYWQRLAARSAFQKSVS